MKDTVFSWVVPILFSILFSIVSVSCGDKQGDSSLPVEEETEQQIKETEGIYSLQLAVREASNLPKCTEERFSTMAYIIDSKRFFVCEEEFWKEIKVSQGDKGEQGERGDSCYELTGDTNVDGLLSVEDCVGKDGINGINGKDGVSCWEVTGDVNEDGELSAEDCVGKDGVNGKDGVGIAGKDGVNGVDGVGIVGKDGKNCYDSTGDVNNDGVLSVEDCVGTAGKDGVDGVGIAGKDGRDGVNGVDGVGIQGEAGSDGANCWDAIGDVNRDGILNASDCVFALMTSRELTFYVNKNTGSDANNCETAPCATIMAAINLVPKHVKHNVVINVVAGTYNEQVIISGFQLERTKTFSITATGGRVVLDGLDQAYAGLSVVGSDYFSTAWEDTGIRITGFSATRFSFGAVVKSALAQFVEFQATDNQTGILVESYGYLDFSWGVVNISSNHQVGIHILNYGKVSSRASLAVSSNSQYGIWVENGVFDQTVGTVTAQSNAIGLAYMHRSYGLIAGSVAISSNSIGIQLSESSALTLAGGISISSNTTNAVKLKTNSTFIQTRNCNSCSGVTSVESGSTLLYSMIELSALPGIVTSTGGRAIRY